MRRLLSICLATTALAGAAQAQPAADDVEAIVVYGRLEGEAARQIPQTVDVLGEQLLDATRAETIGDVLRLVPGASRDGSELDAFGDSFLMRGFSTTQTVNGVGVSFLNQPRDAVNVQRIEVLKGPASVLYGQAQPGAIVNVVTKQPEGDFSAEAGFEFGSYNLLRATGDVTGPLSERVRGRLTAAVEQRESFIEIWDREHQFVSPVVAFELAPRTTLTLEGFYSRTHWGAFFNGMPAEGTVLQNPNGPLPPQRQYTDPAFDGITRSATELTARLEHEFSEGAAWRGTASWSEGRNKGEEIFGLLGWEDADQRLLMRALMDANSTQSSYALSTDFRLRFETGPLEHNLLLGADYRRSQLDLTRTIGLIPSLDLYAPAFQKTAKPPVIFAIDDLSDVTDRTSDAYGVFVQNRFKVSDALQFVAGARYSKLEEDLFVSTAAGTSDTFSQSPSQWTAQLGAVFAPTDNLSLFANYTTSFVPTQGTRVGGAPLDPETGVQYEAGLKARAWNGRLSATAAVFQLTRADVSVSDPANPSFQISIGEQRVRGLELSAVATPVPSLTLYAGYAFTDSETTEDTNAALVGKRLRNVPSHTFALDAAYQAAERLEIGGTANYVSERSGDLEETFELPAYWRVDLRAAFQASQNVRLVAAVQNVLDEEIYSHAFSLYEVFPAAPRTFKLSIEAAF
ncbi:MAG TPA: TonB-dependent siderophore receptor [Caulobacter sp.]|nr:TonB-dependent siderophore receptor [Caulobacter sp.]